jgi:hypothetical protein
MKINPYFELNGNRYEFKKTRWLVAEYSRLNEENPLSDEDRANAVKASNLVSDVQKFAEKADECWNKLCEEPTEENQRIYLMFKAMSDNAINDYNAFVSHNDTLNIASKRNIEILEKIAIKALAEQYYNGNENLASQTWEQFVDTVNNNNKIGEWLNAMAECLFADDSEDEDNSFLAQKRKADEEKAANRKAALHGKR